VKLRPPHNKSPQDASLSRKDVRPSRQQPIIEVPSTSERQMYDELYREQYKKPLTRIVIMAGNKRRDFSGYLTEKGAVFTTDCRIIVEWSGEIAAEPNDLINVEHDVLSNLSRAAHGDSGVGHNIDTLLMVEVGGS
jgi:hypothetical protein